MNIMTILTDYINIQSYDVSLSTVLLVLGIMFGLWLILGIKGQH